MVGLYTRVSTQEQINGFSLDEQTERMKKYSEAMGWDVYGVYTDAGFSGSNTERPALQRLIRDVENHRIDRVLVYKLDRLSRSQKDTLLLIEDVFLAHGCDFVSMSENFDTSTPFGRAMIGVLAVFAQLERDQIKERMMMGKEASVRQGGYQGGRFIPIGYNKGFIPDTYESMLIREVYSMASRGLSPYAIADSMNERGLTHKYGEWNNQSVRRVLESKTYLGFKKYRGEWYPSHEPIITQDEWDRVQTMRELSRERHNVYLNRSGRATTYLGGFLWCGQCGAKYAKNTTTKTRKDGTKLVYEKFSCNSRVGRIKRLVTDPDCHNRHWDVQELTDLIFGEIRKLALDPSRIKPREAVDHSAIHDELDNLTDQMNRLMDLYTIGDIPIDAIQTRIASINDRRMKLEESIKKESETRPLDMEIIRSLSDVLDRGDFDQIRSVIRSLIRRIELDGDDIRIYWTFV